MSFSNEFDKLLVRLELYIGRYQEALRTDARAEMLTQLLSEVVGRSAEFMGSPLGQDVSEAARDALAQLLRPLAQDPYLTLRLAEYLRTRINAIEDAATRFVTLAIGTNYQDASGTNDQPSPGEVLESKIREQTGYLESLLYATAGECRAISVLIPPAITTLDTILPPRRFGMVPDVPRIPGPDNVPGATTGLMRIEPRAQITRLGKSQHLAATVSTFLRRLDEALQQHRTCIDQAGSDGVYDPVVLQSVADRLYDTIERARISCKDLDAVAQEPVGIRYILISRQSPGA